MKGRFFLVVSAAAIFLVLAGICPVAAETGEKLVFDLGEIVVISEEEESKSARTTDAKDLDQFTSETADNVAEALSNMKGLVVTTGTKNEARVLIRGFD